MFYDPFVWYLYNVHIVTHVVWGFVSGLALPLSFSEVHCCVGLFEVWSHPDRFMFLHATAAGQQLRQLRTNLFDVWFGLVL